MHNIYRYFLLGVGTISLGLGILGIVLPLLPTTPFILLTAACYYKGSDRLYKHLINHKVLGKYIDDYRNKGGITLKVKVYALALLWLSMSYCIILLDISPYVKIFLFIVASCVTYHIASRKTLRE